MRRPVVDILLMGLLLACTTVQAAAHPWAHGDLRWRLPVAVASGMAARVDTPIVGIEATW